MEDFKLILDYVFGILSIEIPIFGHYFSLITVILATSILSLAIGFVVHIFGGD